MSQQNLNSEQSRLSDEELFSDINSYLPDATENQVESFVTQIRRLETLKNIFEEISTDDKESSVLKRFKNLLERAEKAFNYQRSYRIAVIGLTGIGKSTLLNALLGRIYCQIFGLFQQSRWLK